MSIQNFKNFDQISYQFRQTNQKSKELEKNLENYITTNTQNEKAQLDLALKNYEKKVQTLMDNKKSQISMIEDYHQQKSTTLNKTYDAFNKTINSIKNNPNLSDDQKEKRINETADYIMSSLYTQEEVNEFKNYANNLVIVIPNEEGQYSRLTTHQNNDTPRMADLKFY